MVLVKYLELEWSGYYISLQSCQKSTNGIYMFLSDSIDLSVENWQNHFLSIMNLYIPRKPL